jgi:hypothetical protein
MQLRWLALIVFTAGLSAATPPTDPKDLELYSHCQEWLKNFPSAYIATNVRGFGTEYAVRRQAALDMLRERRDFGTVYELMVDLDKGNILGDQIIDLLVEWKARRALPLLEQISVDKSRAKELREKARLAVAALNGAAPDAPPPTFH